MISSNDIFRKCQDYGIEATATNEGNGSLSVAQIPSLNLPTCPFAFMACELPSALWNDAALELVPNKIIWLLEAFVILLVSTLWNTVCTDAVLDTDDWCWKICWWEWCKLFDLDFVRLSGNSAMSFSSVHHTKTKRKKINIKRFREKKTQTSFGTMETELNYYFVKQMSWREKCEGFLVTGSKVIFFCDKTIWHIWNDLVANCVVHHRKCVLLMAWIVT